MSILLDVFFYRPTSTRGRGSAHYSTSGASESSPQTPNRGTPPTLDLCLKRQRISRALFKLKVVIACSCTF